MLEGCTEETTRCTNQLHGYLDKHLPGYESCFGKGNGVTSALSLAVLKKAAFPEDILDLGEEGMLGIWKEAGPDDRDDRILRWTREVRRVAGRGI